MNLAEAVISLYPHTWDQQNNRARWITLSKQLNTLTGGDGERYNAVVELMEAKNYTGFCELVRKIAKEQGL